MADNPNSSSVPSTTNSTNATDNDKNNQEGDKEKEDCLQTTNDEEKYSSANEEEKTTTKLLLLFRLLLPFHRLPKILFLWLSAEEFNDEFYKSSTVLKYGISSCKNTLYIRKCSTPQCGKLRCYHCIHMLHKKHRLPSLLLEDDKVDPTHNEEVPVCMKGCYSAVRKILDKGDDAQIPWNKDGRNGEDEPNNSDAILLNWLITEGNYRRYRGDIGHHKKVDVAKRVADIINAAGVRRKRTGKQVQSKIKHLEACFKNALTFANSETGTGLKEKDEGNFEDQCLRQCLHYFDLYDVFADRPGIQPSFTSDKRNNSDESESKGINLYEQKKIAGMAFNNDLDKEGDQEDDDLSSCSEKEKS